MGASDLRPDGSYELDGGSCDPIFNPVREEFRDILTADPSHGAALAVTIGGKLLVNLWGGTARPGEPWRESTRCVVWSTTKGMSALCVQLLADRGEIDLSSAVSRYWPEFAAAGKDFVTVSHVLSHRAGLPYWEASERVACLDEPATFKDTRRIAVSLAQAHPVIRPGEELAYHAITYGWLLDEIVLRVTGKHLGECFDELLARPLGLNIRIGPSSIAVGRPAKLGVIELDPGQLAEVLERNRSTKRSKAMLFRRAESAVEVDHFANDHTFIECGQPAVGGLSDAKSLARAYGLLASGGTLDGINYLSRHSIGQFSSTARKGYDLVLDRQVDRALGYLRNLDGQEFGPPPNAFGHNGLGGSTAFADPDARVGFGFVMNGLDLSPNSAARGLRLSRALYACL